MVLKHPKNNKKENVQQKHKNTTKLFTPKKQNTEKNKNHVQQKTIKYKHLFKKNNTPIIKKVTKQYTL